MTSGSYCLLDSVFEKDGRNIEGVPSAIESQSVYILELVWPAGFTSVAVPANHKVGYCITGIQICLVHELFHP